MASCLGRGLVATGRSLLLHVCSNIWQSNSDLFLLADQEAEGQSLQRERVGVQKGRYGPSDFSCRVPGWGNRKGNSEPYSIRHGKFGEFETHQPA